MKDILGKMLYAKRVNITAYLILSCAALYFYGGLITAYPLHNHETPNLYFRLFELMQEFKNVGFPPAIFPNSIHGGGFAFPLFYPPLGNYIAALIAVLTKNIYFACNFSLFLTILLSGYTAYYAFSQIGHKSVALMGALVYITFPYRFVDTIVRGSLAESLTFVWLPLVFCGGILVLRRHNRKGFVILALASAALLLSHAVMAMYFISIYIGIFLLVCFASWRLLPLVYVSGALGLAAMLSAWYVIPQQVLLPTVKASDSKFMWADLVDAPKHNTDFSQLFYTDPARWTGGSNEGVANDGMSYELGLASTMLIFVVVALLIWFSNKQLVNSRALIIFKWLTMLSWILSIIFLLRCEWFLKILPKQFLYIQFAWRMFGITGFLCAATYVLFFNSYVDDLRQKTIMLGIAVMSIVMVNPSNRIILYDKSMDATPITEKMAEAKGDKGFVEIAEYLPIEFREYERDRLKSNLPTFIGNMDITSCTITQTKITAQVVARTSSTLLLPLLAYPVYQARTQDGRILTQSSFNGLLTFEGIQPNDTEITVVRAMPLPQKVGLIVSVAGVLVLFGILFLPIWQFKSSEMKHPY